MLRESKYDQILAVSHTILAGFNSAYKSSSFIFFNFGTIYFFKGKRGSVNSFI